jgi:hypothetical protein
LAPGRTAFLAMVHKTYAFCFFLAAVFYVVLPLTIYGSSKLSASTTAPLASRYEKTFADVREVFSMESLLDRDLELPSASAASDGWQQSVTNFLFIVKETVRMTIHRFRHMNTKAREVYGFLTQGGAGELAEAVFLVCVVYVLDGFVYPAAAFWVLLWFAKQLVFPLAKLDAVAA